jgi:C1A family cysteine protease
VGFGVDDKTNYQYYIVKNSWGESWGEKGYARIKINTDKNDAGICGIQSRPSFYIADVTI